MEMISIKYNKLVSFVTELLWEQAGGEDEEGPEAAVRGEDLSEEDAVGAHSAPAGLLHRLRGACHPGKKSHGSAREMNGSADEALCDWAPAARMPDVVKEKATLRFYVM